MAQSVTQPNSPIVFDTDPEFKAHRAEACWVCTSNSTTMYRPHWLTPDCWCRPIYRVRNCIMAGW